MYTKILPEFQCQIYSPAQFTVSSADCSRQIIESCLLFVYVTNCVDQQTADWRCSLVCVMAMCTRNIARVSFEPVRTKPRFLVPPRSTFIYFNGFCNLQIGYVFWNISSLLCSLHAKVSIFIYKRLATGWDLDIWKSLPCIFVGYVIQTLKYICVNSF